MNNAMCSHCHRAIIGNPSRNYGTHVAHHEYECIAILNAEIESLRKDAERWRYMRDVMTHEHSWPNIGWTLGILLPGDDPDDAVDKRIQNEVIRLNDIYR